MEVINDLVKDLKNNYVEQKPGIFRGLKKENLPRFFSFHKTFQIIAPNPVMFKLKKRGDGSIQSKIQVHIFLIIFFF